MVRPGAERRWRLWRLWRLAMAVSAVAFLAAGAWGVLAGFPEPDAPAERAARLRWHADAAGLAMAVALVALVVPAGAGLRARRPRRSSMPGTPEGDRRPGA